MHPAPVHSRAPEGGQERGVDVDDPAAKARDDRSVDEFEVARQHHQLRAGQGGQHLGGVAGVAQHRGGHAGPARPLQRAGVGTAGDHACNAGDGGIVQGVEEGLQVRAAARHQHGDTNRFQPFSH